MTKALLVYFFLLMTLLSSCTFLNKQSFEIIYPNQSAPNTIIEELESYFSELGFVLERKSSIMYPRDERFAQFFISKQTNPLLLYTAFDHLNLRLVGDKRLYIDWVRISDIREVPPPGYFDEFYHKLSQELERRLGVNVSFKMVVENKSF